MRAHFQDLGGYFYGSVTQTATEQPVQFQATWVTPNLIRLRVSAGGDPVVAAVGSDAL
jgi:hypothetical protein